MRIIYSSAACGGARAGSIPCCEEELREQSSGAGAEEDHWAFGACAGNRIIERNIEWKSTNHSGLQSPVLTLKAYRNQLPRCAPTGSPDDTASAQEKNFAAAVW